MYADVCAAGIWHGVKLRCCCSLAADPQQPFTPVPPCALLSLLCIHAMTLAALALTAIASSSAIAGGAVVIWRGVPSDSALGHMLAFACGIMLYISYADLLPHAMESLPYSGPAWFIGGMLLFLAVTALIPEPDLVAAAASVVGPGPSTAEPDHASKGQVSQLSKRARAALQASSTSPISRARSTQRGQQQQVAGAASSAQQATVSQPQSSLQATSAASAPTASKQRLMLTALLAALGVALHNFPEGLIVYTQSLDGVCSAEGLARAQGQWAAAQQAPLASWDQLRWGAAAASTASSACAGRAAAITFAIALHNIPEGMAVAAPVLGATGSAKQAMLWCTLSALAEPAAAAMLWPFSDSLSEHVIAVLNAVVAGIMVGLVLVELVPQTLQRLSAPKTAFSMIVGKAVMAAGLVFMASQQVGCAAGHDHSHVHEHAHHRDHHLHHLD